MTSASPQLAGHSEERAAPRAAAAAAWGADLAAYEREKRGGFSTSFGAGGVTQAAPQTGHVFAKERERAFDPLLQRLRDGDAEAKRQLEEDKRRLEHINRAHDAQLLREQPCDIINHSSRLEALAPGQDPMLLDSRQRRSQGKRCEPTERLDYNVLSNLPFETHHWAPPGDRPKQRERVHRQRSGPDGANARRDYNMLAAFPDGKEQQEQHPNLSLLESTKKFMKRCPFNPVSQQFTDPRYEERFEAAKQARHAQGVHQAAEQLPDSIRTREAACYGILSHDIYDGDRLDLDDAIEQDRLNKFCAYRYTYERRMREQDLEHEQAEHVRREARFAPEKFEEEKKRGYDILDNKAFGHGPREKLYREPRARPRLSPWEKVQASLDASSTAKLSSSLPMLPPPHLLASSVSADDAGFDLERPAPLPPPWVGGTKPAAVATPSQTPVPRLASSASAPSLLSHAPAGLQRPPQLSVADALTGSPPVRGGSGLLLQATQNRVAPPRPIVLPGNAARTSFARSGLLLQVAHDGVAPGAAPPAPAIPGKEMGAVFSRPAC